MHGASEKQRRDRMNVLVEELRVLGASRCCMMPIIARLTSPTVPAPNCPETGAQVPESKRSKCAVLQDTANAVRELRQRCEAQETELEALRAMAASASQRTTQQSVSPAAVGTPSGHPTVVKVCGGEPGRWLLIITCADRRGLLADLMNAVRGLGLSVARASIVTKADGSVHDVFETQAIGNAPHDDDAADGSIPSQPVPLDADTVHTALEAAISNARLSSMGPGACGASAKRKKTQ